MWIVRGNYMKHEAGLWIDYRQAVIVFVLDQEEAITRIRSSLKQDVGAADATHARVTPTSKHDTGGDESQFDDPVSRYLDKVIAYLRGATTTLILGPGLTKFALQKRLEAQQLGHRIASIQTAARMTDRQIAAEVCQYFRPASTVQPQLLNNGRQIKKSVADGRSQLQFSNEEVQVRLAENRPVTVSART
jgi:hypothetical protein